MDIQRPNGNSFAFHLFEEQPSIDSSSAADKSHADAIADAMAVPAGMLPEIEDDLAFSAMLRKDMPVGKLNAAFRKYSAEYNRTTPPNNRDLERAMFAAEPYLKALGDTPSEYQVEEALVTGVKIRLLEGWLIEQMGMQPFPAALKAVQLEGNIPGQNDDKPSGMEFIKV